MSKTAKCIDCKKQIWSQFNRCKSCENKRRWKDPILRKKYLKTVQGKNHPNYGNKGIKSPLFKNKDLQTSKGYVLTYAPKHPSVNGKNYWLKHRAMVECFINNISFKDWKKYSLNGNFPENFRFLKSKEIIHHINGIKNDNRIKNLILFPNTKSHQQFIHFGDNKFICKFCKKDQRNG